MKTTFLVLNLLFSLLWSANSYSQSAPTVEKLSVEERLAKARAAKAEKRVSKTTSDLGSRGTGINRDARTTVKATPADYQAPVDKVLKGPNGEVVHTGERGAKFYINKNGNKTYLSSNQ